MAKEMSPKVFELYTKFAAQEKENKIRRSEEAGKRERVRKVFEQGVNILEEFGEAREGRRGIPGALNISGIRVFTPLVVLEHEGKEVNFTIQRFKPYNSSPKSLSPDSYEYISVHRVKKGDRNFEVDNAWLFRIDAGRIFTPITKEDNDPEVIEAASEFFNVIQQSLSETVIPRSQQVKPETGQRRLLVNILRRLNPAGNL